MGKKKSYYKKQLKSFFKGNRVILAALGGVAAGISIAGILGTEKAQQMLHAVEGNLKDFSDKVANSIGKSSEVEIPSHIK